MHGSCKECDRFWNLQIMVGFLENLRQKGGKILRQNGGCFGKFKTFCPHIFQGDFRCL